MVNFVDSIHTRLGAEIRIDGIILTELAKSHLVLFVDGVWLLNFLRDGFVRFLEISEKLGALKQILFVVVHFPDFLHKLLGCYATLETSTHEFSAELVRYLGQELPFPLLI